MRRRLVALPVAFAAILLHALRIDLLTARCLRLLLAPLGHGKTVLLGVRGMKGQFGKDWSVAWSGCEVLDGGKACRIVPENETTVGAVFTGQPL